MTLGGTTCFPEFVQTPRGTPTEVKALCGKKFGSKCGILRCSRKRFKSQSRTKMTLYRSRKEL